MFEGLINFILYRCSYFQLYILVTFYFLFLYFALAPLFLWVCKFLNRKNILHKIIDKEPSHKTILFEIRHSFQSVLIFGFSGLPVVYLIRKGAITLLPDSFLNIFIGIVVLTAWNEFHFFIVHRLMHTPFFMKHVHQVHHKSFIPTVYSVYSFHWFEALLLSTVPLTIAPFISFAPTAIFLYPLASILLNYAGHCNYRFGNGEGNSWQLFGTRHCGHHVKNTSKYGFAIDLFDRINLNYKKTTKL